MPAITPLPAAVRALLKHNTHPGLLLDKYVASYDPDAGAGKLSERVQRPAVESVAALSQGPPPDFPFEELSQRRRQMLTALHARFLAAVTLGPFTLHLARSSSLENAGICLHPLYGFVYLLGSGVKGMAHAFACQAWLPAQPDRPAAWQAICQVFGWAPSRWLNDLAERLGVRPPRDACAGAVVFHDAWPDTWPRLQIDILNNHHSRYYQKGEPPGDWDSPVPVYFLSVPAGQRFSFAVAPRRSDCAGDLLDRAVEWLSGALEHLGAGAKTASGYGDFRVEGEPGCVSAPSSASSTATLELVTPGFFAGADQEKAEQCVLRPASLRGMLRWWWRTLHAGFVDSATLSRLEAAVWGDVRAGAPVRLTLEALGEHRPARFDKRQAQRDHRLPQPPDTRTTPGLWYHTFGMDDNRTEDGVTRRVQRWFLPPGSRWRVLLSARPATFSAAAGERRGVSPPVQDATGGLDPASVPGARRRAPGPVVPADLVVQQARAALWLLCRFGGVGAKCRKGFGAFADPQELGEINLAWCKEQAARFREACGLGRGSFDARQAGSPALEQALWLEEPLAGWANVWLALDQVGASAQAFAKTYKHRREKQALGLPRKIGHPAQGNFRKGRHVADRHAAPVWYHLGRGPGGLVLRVTAFPACELPSLDESQAILERLLEHLRADLPGRFAQYATAGQATPPPPPAGGGGAKTPAPPPAAVPRAGDRVEAELLAEKTKKGGWQARHPGTGLSGPIVNSADVPADRNAGDRVTLIVASVSSQGMSFRWPTAAELAAPPKAGPTPGKPSGGKPGRRK
jgi:CRISPR-associated protein Cmr6